jgi:hypothetical protein
MNTSFVRVNRNQSALFNLGGRLPRGGHNHGGGAFALFFLDKAGKWVQNSIFHADFLA